MSKTTTYMIRFADDLFGVYGRDTRGPYGTPLLFVGSFDECVAYRRIG